MTEPTNRATRNKLFSALPPVKWCGNNNNSVPCTDQYKTLSCAAGIDGSKAVQNCPGDYIEEGLVYSKDCIGGGWIVNPKVRKCNKKPVDDAVFNPLETEYNNAKPSERTQAMLDEIESCCIAQENSPRCGNLYDGTKNNERICQIYKQNSCLDTLDNLSTDDCVEWCAKNRDVCTTAKISKFCQNDKINPTDKKYDRVCGCYYKNEFYNKLQKELADKFQIPQEFLSGGRSCYFSGCNGSPLNPNPNEIKDKCKSISLSQCFQNVSLQSGGALYVDKDAVIQDLDCKTQITQTRKLYAKCTSKEDCGSNLECINGQCTGNPATSTSCTEDKDCSGKLTCISGKCIDNTTPSPVSPPIIPPVIPPVVTKKDAGAACISDTDCKAPLECSEDFKCTAKPSNLPLIIGLSVGGIVFLLIIAGIFFKINSSKQSSTTSS